ncbi:hypothetical protein H4R33_001748 [Dimargaris cristalligena]|uniref:Uncharacterized protein n=1 Tax=Dimargaris cristalligena TaxID=215637 RepID=A0A4P9ZZ02_9FUNG|nr:hypothetical protein H4R33_001748 [Dimargaris cristalligena]RKP38986.1 hypothetical protein BJ085DRAFT_34428 [Dimargaris cristalligena]|eukprot:RKP38986.1 hypothetical protein BJ085DRAFT_34428 [Dimargaris cristalligena]
MKFNLSFFIITILAPTLGSAAPVAPEVPQNPSELLKRTPVAFHPCDLAPSQVPLSRRKHSNHSREHRHHSVPLIDSDQYNRLSRRTPSPVPLSKQPQHKNASSNFSLRNQVD